MRYFRAIPIAIIAFQLFSGCTKNDSTNPVDTGGVPSPGNVEISNAKRTVVLNSLKSIADSMQRVNPSAINAVLLNYFSSRPEFQATGTGPDGTVYAIFGDGRVLICGDNLASGTPGGIPAQSTAAIEQAQRLSKTATGLPNFQTVLLMNSLGSRFDYTNGPTGVTKTSQDIAQMFTKAGYKDVTQSTATIEALKGVRGAAIFHFTTHAGTGYLADKKTQVYSLMSSTPRDSAKDVGIYKDDFDAKRITYMLFPVTTSADSKQQYIVAYGITPAFVTQYMSFPTNSLAYITACSSYSSDMRAAFAAAGASTYVGWTNTVVAFQAFDASRFFFDRSLGTNLVSPIPSPKQRPFSFYLVLEDMMYRGIAKSVTKEGTADLQMASLKDDLTDLLPSLSFSTFISYANRLTLNVQGEWGTAAGKILLNGLPLNLAKAWNHSSVELDMPTGGGNLQVEVNGLQSNVVQLTQWDGTITYTVKGRGTLQRKVTANLRFIGDMHRWRVVSGANIVWKDEAVFLMPRMVGTLSSSSCTYECSGEYRNSQGELEEAWSGSGSIPISPIPAAAIPGAYLYGTIGDVGQTTSLGFLASAPYTRTTKSSSQQLVFTTSQGVSSTISTAVGADYALKSNTLTGSTSDGSVTLTWTDFKPAYTPDPNAAR